MRARLFVGLLVIASVVGAVGVVSGVQPGESDGSEEWTLEEIQRNGAVIPDANPSKRWLGQQGSVTASYEESNVLKEMTSPGPDPEWAIDHVLQPDAMVDVNEVTLQFSRGRDAEAETVHVKVVSARTAMRSVEEGNKTVRKRVATNVSVQTHEVRLNGAADRVTISLPNHAEKPYEMLIFVEEYPEARWSFTHHSVATQKSLPFAPNMLGLFSWLARTLVVILAIGLPAAIWGADRTVSKVHAGPGKPAMFYLVTGTLVGYSALYFAYNDVVRWLTEAPWVIAGFLILLVYLVAMHRMDRTFPVLAEQLLTEDVKSPLGDSVPDIEEERGKLVHAVRSDDGTHLSFVKKGSIRQFIVRLLGAEPAKVDVSDLKSRVRYSSNFAEEKLYADEDSDMVLGIRYPSVSWSADAFRTTTKNHEWDGDGGTMEETVTTWDRGAIARAAVAFGVFTLGGINLLKLPVAGALFVGAIPLVKMMAVPNHGEAKWEPEWTHATAAKARAVTEETTYEEFRTFADLQEEVAESDAEKMRQARDIGEAYLEAAREEFDDMMRIGGEESRRSRGPGETRSAREEVAGDDD